MDEHNKLHVDVITKFFIPVAGGIEQNIAKTYKVMQKDLGWDVTIHTLADSYTERNCFPCDDEIEGLRVKRYPRSGFGYTPQIDWEKTDVVALHNFDIFFCKFLFRALWMKIRGKKHFALILTAHGGFNPEWSMFPVPGRWIKEIYTYTLGTWLINATVDGVRAVSEWEKSVESKYINSKLLRTIDNGLEDEAYVDMEVLASQQIKQDVERYGKYIIQIGRVYPIKNFETAIESLAYIPADYNLVIVGQLQEEEYRQKLYSLIEKLGLKDRVFFAGVVRGVDKYYLIKHAQVMVHMALWESYGNVLREGMSQGLPCIVSDVYNMPLLVKDGVNGFCLPVHDAKQVGEKLNWIFDPVNAESVGKMRERNREFGKGQSWSEVAERMDVFYRGAKR
jgi:glycosyltransferase involved in cell wall biosynthesis